MSVKEWWRRFREFDRKGPFIHKIEGNFSITTGGYRFDRRIFRVYLGVVFLIILGTMITSSVGWREIGLSCPSNTPGACPNPCYQGTGRCAPYAHIETIQPGETLGTLPTREFERRVRGVWQLSVGLGVLAFVLNHFRNNKRKGLKDLFPELRV